LNLPEILLFYLVDRLYLSVAVTYRRQILQYLVGFRGRRKLIAICGKLATVCRGICKLYHGIWRNLPWKTAVPSYGNINAVAA